MAMLPSVGAFFLSSFWAMAGAVSPPASSRPSNSPPMILLNALIGCPFPDVCRKWWLDITAALRRPKAIWVKVSRRHGPAAPFRAGEQHRTQQNQRGADAVIEG